MDKVGRSTQETHATLAPYPEQNEPRRLEAEGPCAFGGKPWPTTSAPSRGLSSWAGQGYQHRVQVVRAASRTSRPHYGPLLQNAHRVNVDARVPDRVQVEDVDRVRAR